MNLWPIAHLPTYIVFNYVQDGWVELLRLNACGCLPAKLFELVSYNRCLTIIILHTCMHHACTCTGTNWYYYGKTQKCTLF